MSSRAALLSLLLAIPAANVTAGDAYIPPPTEPEAQTDPGANRESTAADGQVDGRQPANAAGGQAAEGPSAATPQPSTPAPTRIRPLTLQRALQTIFESHPSVQAARNRFGASNLQYEAALYGALPTLEIDAGRLNGGSGQNGSGSQSTYRLTQPLYTFGRITNTANAAEKRVDGARDAVLEQTRNLQEQSITAYFEVLRARDRLATAKDNTAAHVKLEEMITRRFGAGVGSESDQELAKTRRNQAQNDEAAAQAAYRKTLNTLRSLLSIDINELLTPQLIQSPYKNETELLDRAFMTSPQIRRLTNEAEALKFDAEVLKASTRPQVVLRAERIETAAPSNFSDSRLIAALQFNPGAGLSAVSNANAGLARSEAAKQDIEAAKRELTDKVRILMSDYQQTQDQLAFLETLKKSNSLLVESFLRQFQAGKRSWLDVLNSQRESTQASLSFVDSFYAAQSLANRMKLIAGEADNIGGVSEIRDLPTRPTLLQGLLSAINPFSDKSAVPKAKK